MKQFTRLAFKSIFSVFLVIVPILVWLIAISATYSILYSIPITGDSKILIESLQISPVKLEKEKLPGYREGWFFEIKAQALPGGPDQFFYITTNHKTSDVNEPYFHTTTQRLYRNYGTDIRKASPWERTTRNGQFTSLGAAIFLVVFVLISTLCLASYFPLVGFILRR